MYFPLALFEPSAICFQPMYHLFSLRKRTANYIVYQFNISFLLKVIVHICEMHHLELGRLERPNYKIT